MWLSQEPCNEILTCIKPQRKTFGVWPSPTKHRKLLVIRAGLAQRSEPAAVSSAEVFLLVYL